MNLCTMPILWRAWHWQQSRVARQAFAPMVLRDIKAIRKMVSLPLIGLFKDGNTGVYITPTFEHARAVVNASGGIAAARTFAPYGAVDTNFGTFGNRFGYAGEMVDVNGLSYNRARYYAPAFGTFLSLDPFEGFTQMPQSVNGYNYVMGNPVNYTDPSGNFINVIGGALLGGSLGALFGYVQGQVLYALAAAGSCGCPRQIEALQKGQEAYVREMTALGALFGAVGGAILSTPVGAAVGPVLDILTDLDILNRIKNIWNDFFSDFWLDDWCAVADLIAIIGGRALMKHLPVDDILGPGKPQTRQDIDNMGMPPGSQRSRPSMSRPGSGCSFSAETEVATQSGTKPIADIQIGDVVTGYNEAMGTIDCFHVTAIHQQEYETAINVIIAGEIIHTTDGHPFFVKNKGWVEAGKLAVNDRVVKADGTTGRVENVILTDKTHIMYNLTVQHVATYLVGIGKWVVHNAGPFLFPDMPEPIRPPGVHSDQLYTVFYEVELRPGTDYPIAITSKLDEGRIRSQHNTYGNQQLYRMLGEIELYEPKLFTQLNKQFPEIISHLKYGRADTPPPGWTWHHYSYKKGIMQLIPISQHTHKPLLPILHPDEVGGFGRWTNTNNPSYGKIPPFGSGC